MLPAASNLEAVLRELSAGLARIRAQADLIQHMQPEEERNEAAADLLGRMQATAARIASDLEFLRRNAPR
jgi:hypothetical protein